MRCSHDTLLDMSNVSIAPTAGASAVVLASTPLASIRHLATIPVHHESEPSLASVMGISKFSAYRAVRRGEFASIRVGHRILVPVPPLRRQLGDLPDADEAVHRA